MGSAVDCGRVRPSPSGSGRLLSSGGTRGLMEQIPRSFREMAPLLKESRMLGPRACTGPGMWYLSQTLLISCQHRTRVLRVESIGFLIGERMKRLVSQSINCAFGDFMPRNRPRIDDHGAGNSVGSSTALRKDEFVDMQRLDNLASRHLDARDFIVPFLRN